MLAHHLPGSDSTMHEGCSARRASHKRAGSAARDVGKGAAPVVADVEDEQVGVVQHHPAANDALDAALGPRGSGN